MIALGADVAVPVALAVPRADPAAPTGAEAPLAGTELARVTAALGRRFSSGMWGDPHKLSEDVLCRLHRLFKPLRCAVLLGVRRLYPVLRGALPARGGCYDLRVAPGGGVCREARDGTCVRHAEEVTDRKKEPMRVKGGSTGCTAETSSADHCASGKCDVIIGDKTYCSQCKANYVPIDDTCTQVGDATSGKCLKAGGQPLTDDTQCGQCGAGYFLHKGGCYQFGGAVGKLICTDPSTPDSSLTAGTCTTCASGYFKNPTQAANKPPCIACNDTTGNNTNKGKAGCATCKPPESSGVAKCTACLDSFFGTGSAEDITCTPCTGDCQTCKGTATQCTSCKPETNPYWKKDTNLDTGTCVSQENCKAGSTHFSTTDKTSQKKICTLCSDAANGGIADCQECSKSGETVTCSACTQNKKPSKAGTKCFECQVTDYSHCSADGVCEACDNTNKVSPGGSSCVPNCPENSSDQSGACICNSGFAPSGDKCTSSSANRSGLSTGTIAGISVAVIVVVG